ncbi:MAG: FAD-binding oxidoreductase [Candidatus Helarchaeota archaeon]
MLKTASKHDMIVEKLKEIVGNEWVSDFPEEMLLYSQDMTENPPNNPEFVVLPNKVEEIQKILKLANENKIPVVPFVTGNNIGGLAIPLKGGLVVDLKRMDKILRLNEDDMYMIIEPGVTFGHVNKFLRDTEFRYCYPMAPPYASVMANALLNGLNNLSYRYGSMANVINGIEAVLPNGELVKIGSCALWDEHWWGNPLPDLLGLFKNWQGMTGIVTKIGLQVWTKKPIRDMQIIISNDFPETYKVVRKVTRSGILNDLLLISIETAKMILGVPYKQAVHLEGEPRWIIFFDFSANNTLEYKGKLKVIEDAFKELKKVDPKALITTQGGMAKLYGGVIDYLKDLPFALYGMMEYGGCTWVGTYMTTKPESVIKGVETAFKVIEKHNFETCLYSRSMSGHHYYAFRFLLRFSKENPEETKRMRALNKELLESLFELGAMPYKTPFWATEVLIKHMDKNTYELFKKVKKMMDPNGIMNPGRWGL